MTELQPILASPRQAADALSLGMTKTFELVKDGELESILIGRSRRITWASIHDLINQRLEKADRA